MKERQADPERDLLKMGQGGEAFLGKGVHELLLLNENEPAMPLGKRCQAERPGLAKVLGGAGDLGVCEPEKQPHESR